MLPGQLLQIKSNILVCLTHVSFNQIMIHFFNVYINFEYILHDFFWERGSFCHCPLALLKKTWLMMIQFKSCGHGSNLCSGWSWSKSVKIGPQDLCESEAIEIPFFEITICCSTTLPSVSCGFCFVWMDWWHGYWRKAIIEGLSQPFSCLISKNKHLLVFWNWWIFWLNICLEETQILETPSKVGGEENIQMLDQDKHSNLQNSS